MTLECVPANLVVQLLNGIITCGLIKCFINAMHPSALHRFNYQEHLYFINYGGVLMPYKSRVMFVSLEFTIEVGTKFGNEMYTASAYDRKWVKLQCTV